MGAYPNIYPYITLRLQDTLAEIDVAGGEAAVLIDVIVDQRRTVRAHVTFDAGLLAAIDAAAQERGLTRSAFLASAAREKMDARQ